MMSEDDPAMGGDEIATVIETLGRGRPGVIHRQYRRGDPGRVKTVTDDVDADAGRDQPEGVYRFVTVQRDATDGVGPDDRQNDPDNAFEHDVPPETVLGGDYGA